MNHYINLLEPSECHYLNSAESNPLYKIGGVALVAGFLAFNLFNYQKLKATVREGQEIEQWLEENEEAVEEARERIALQLRIEQANKTLSGWETSRFNYPDIFTAMALSIPPPADQMEFTLLYFNENLIGMSSPRENPEGNQTEFYPLERQINVELRGRVAGGRPDLKLDAYRNRVNQLSEDQMPLQNLTMRLGNSMEIQGDEEKTLTVTPFSAEITLIPNEVLP